MLINGKNVVLGSVSTNTNGSATLPAISASKPGTYIIQLTSAKGVKYFVKIVVKASK